MIAPCRRGSPIPGLLDALPNTTQYKAHRAERRWRTSIENMWVPYAAGVDIRTVPEASLIQFLRKASRLNPLWERSALKDEDAGESDD